MDQILESLRERAGDLVGQMAGASEISRLAERLKKPEFAPLIRIYQEFPVCGMIVKFSVDPEGTVGPPNEECICEYDPDRDHEFDWVWPAQISQDIASSLAGPAAFLAGFVPIGMSTIGGDDYYLRLLTPRKAPVYLFQVYYDWYDADRGVLVMPEAVHLVCKSFADAIRVAHFE